MRKFINIPFSTEEEKNDFAAKAKQLGFKSITEMVKESVRIYEKQNFSVKRELTDIIDKAYNLITVLQAQRDYGNGLNQEEKQVYNAAFLITEIIARLEIIFNDPANFVDQINEETGTPERVFKYAVYDSKKIGDIVESLKSKSFQ